MVYRCFLISALLKINRVRAGSIQKRKKFGYQLSRHIHFLLPTLVWLLASRVFQRVVGSELGKNISFPAVE